jgi:hypothetical protein
MAETRNGEATQFAPGHPKIPNSGRAKGTRNKLTAAILRDMFHVWEEMAGAVIEGDDPNRGVGALRALAAEDPRAFVKTFVSTLPKELDVNTTTQLDECNDDELATVIALCRAKLGRDPEGSRGDEDEAHSVN